LPLCPGHKPLNFIHRLADGTTRHVQTYAGPIEIYGDKLMLCIIHDITEQKRLEQELEHAALRDSMTGLLNRRQFYMITEQTNPDHLPRSSNLACCWWTPIILKISTTSLAT
jgi:PAS domain-containing protein